ncbi:alanine racemase [Sandaracinobacter neustonicus]|uniref:alanine racemase n=1 Tax=Sandaracinobacter neustonicus TaxID=1715348 RepID=UPI001F287884|nr:alanine racemase [Sandaracinobacter neustonicus]
MRLRLNASALAANFRDLATRAGVPAYAAVKADAYGLGAQEVVRRLKPLNPAGFAVATWPEALALGRADLDMLILHGFTTDCAAAAAALPRARPVLATTAQIAAWATAFPGRMADLMVETGMNRLGIDPADIAAAIAAIPIHTIHSHLACADEQGHPLTLRQLNIFRAIAAATPAHSHALANSAGIHWGRAFSFSAVRPGLGLYGGQAHPDATPHHVVTPEARILQIRTVPAGQSVGYGATWTAPTDSRIAILNIGYADGICRATAPKLQLHAGPQPIPAVGLISMDMIAANVSNLDLSEGDWLSLDWHLPTLGPATGISQYELLTRLGPRFERVWEI